MTFHNITLDSNTLSVLPELEGIEADLTEIQVNDRNTLKPLWTAAGGPVPCTVVAGYPWELRVFYRFRSTQGLVSVSVTCVATGPGYDSRDGSTMPHTFPSAEWDYERFPDLQFADMPANDVNLRIKLWITNAHTDIALPPDDGDPGW